MSKPRILMVDDEVGFLSTMVKRLNKRNFETTGVQSGEEGIRMLAQNSFDVVILDIRMPGLDGIGTLKQLKEIDHGIAVILLTGYASVDSAVEGMKLGAYEFLIKPCEFEELMEKIERAYELKTARDERIRQAEFRQKKIKE